MPRTFFRAPLHVLPLVLLAPLLAVSLPLLMMACGNPADGQDLTNVFESIVRMRASIEFSCPSTQIGIEDLGGFAYRATGCAERATYECEYSAAQGSDQVAWQYICKRAAQDEPERLDGGK